MRKAAFGGDVVVFRRHVEKMFADSEYKWGPISTESERERRRGEEEKRKREAGKESGTVFLPCFITKKGKERRRTIGAKCLRGSAWGRRIVLVVVGPRSECGCEVTHWIIQWMLGEDYFSTNPPAERALLLPTLRKPHFHLLSSFHHSIMSGEISGVSVHRAIEPPFRARKVCRPFRSQPF